MHHARNCCADTVTHTRKTALDSDIFERKVPGLNQLCNNLPQQLAKLAQNIAPVMACRSPHEHSTLHAWAQLDQDATQQYSSSMMIAQ